MADEAVDDSLRVEILAAFDKFDRDVEERRRKAESTPIRIPVEYVERTSSSGTATVTRSFGGQAGQQADVPTRAVNATGPTLQQQLQAAAVLRGVNIGGTGFGPSVGPVPTASTNTYYGQVGYGQVVSPFGSVQALPGTPEQVGSVPVRRTSRLRPPNPADFDEAMAERSARGMAGLAAAYPSGPSTNDLLQQQAIAQLNRPNAPGVLGRLGRGFSSGGIRSYFGAYVGLQTAESAFGAQTQYQVALANAGGDPYAIAQAQIANNPTANFVGGIPLAGGLASAIGGYISGAPAYAARTLSSARLQDEITAAATQRRNASIDARNQVGIATAAAAGSQAEQIAVSAARLTTLDARLQERIRDAQAPYIAKQAALQTEVQRTGDIAFGKAFGGTGYALFGVNAAGQSVSTDLSALPRNPDGTIRTDPAAVGFTPSPASLRNLGGVIGNYNSAVTAQYQNGQRLANVAADIRTQYGLESQAEQIRVRNLAQGQRDQRDLLDQNTMRAGLTARLGFGGYSEQASIQAVFARTQGELSIAQREATRQAGVNTAGFGPDQLAAQQALTERAFAQVRSLQSQQSIELRQATNANRQSRIGFNGGIRAAELDLSFQPLDAQLSRNQTAFDQATVGFDVNSPDYQRALANRNIADRQATQGFRLNRQRVDNSLRAELQAQNYSLARNQIGAAAAGLTGNAINRIQSLQQAGLGSEAEQARALALGDLDVLQQDYRYSFRGEQIGQGIFLGNQRDAEDPAEAFAAIARQRNLIQNADAEAGIDRQKTPAANGVEGTVKIDTDSIREQASAIARELNSLLVN